MLAGVVVRDDEGAEQQDELTWWQRFGIRAIRRDAGRDADEALRPEDWEVVWKLHARGVGGAAARLMRVLPSSPSSSPDHAAKITSRWP